MAADRDEACDRTPRLSARSFCFMCVNEGRVGIFVQGVEFPPLTRVRGGSGGGGRGGGSCTPDAEARRERRMPRGPSPSRNSSSIAQRAHVRPAPSSPRRLILRAMRRARSSSYCDRGTSPPPSSSGKTPDISSRENSKRFACDSERAGVHLILSSHCVFGAPRARHVTSGSHAPQTRAHAHGPPLRPRAVREAARA
jgi:hypothetical protein